MSTVFDWVAMAIFAVIAVLFLQRSVSEAPHSDKIYHYAPPAIGCALANYLGNHDHRAIAAAVFIAVVGYVLFVLRPFGKA
jgi:hypothetical protein